MTVVNVGDPLTDHPAQLVKVVIIVVPALSCVKRDVVYRHQSHVVAVTTEEQSELAVVVGVRCLCRGMNIEGLIATDRMVTATDATALVRIIKDETTATGVVVVQCIERTRAHARAVSVGQITSIVPDPLGDMMQLNQWRDPQWGQAHVGLPEIVDVIAPGSRLVRRVAAALILALRERRKRMNRP
jgi:hypothetical protein